MLALVITALVVLVIVPVVVFLTALVGGLFDIRVWDAYVRMTDRLIDIVVR